MLLLAVAALGNRTAASNHPGRCQRHRRTMLLLQPIGGTNGTSGGDVACGSDDDDDRRHCQSTNAPARTLVAAACLCCLVVLAVMVPSSPSQPTITSFPPIPAALRHVPSAASDSHDGAKHGIQDMEIQQALSVLQRIGVQGPCHPSSGAFAPRIPLCPIRGDSRRLHATDGEGGDGLWFTLLNVAACLVCIMSVALMSCMFLGFMTLDPLDLRIQIRASADAKVRERAAQLLPIVEENHRLLVTLLLAEAVFYESMPLLMDNLLPSWAAILMSVTVLLVFGEIIPSAFVTGPAQLQWASRLIPLMNFLLWILHPVAAPLTWMLDTLVPPGEAEDEYYDRGELSALIKIQFEDREREDRLAALGGGGRRTPHSRAVRGGPNGGGPAAKVTRDGGVHVGGNAVSVTVAEKSRGWRNLKREIMEAVETRRVEQLNQLQQQLHSQQHQSNQMLFVAPGSPGGGGTASPISGLGGGAFQIPHHQYHHSTGSVRSSGGDNFGTGGGGGAGVGVGELRGTRGQNRAMSIGSDSESVNSFTTPPAYEQIAPPLHQAEMNVLEGALTMKTKCAWDVYTPLRKIFSVPYDLELDRNTIAEIYSEGYSRIPVYERPPPPHQDRKYAIRGVLMTRHLIMIDWADERLVSSLPLYTPPCVSPRMNLVDLLQLLQQGGSHIAFVCAGPDVANQALEDDRPIPVEAGFMGLVTLEDVLEAILQARIYDEDDVADRDLASATLTQWAAKILQRFYRRKRAMARLSIGSASELAGAFDDDAAVTSAMEGAGDGARAPSDPSGRNGFIQNPHHQQQQQPHYQQPSSPYRPASWNATMGDSNRFGATASTTEPSIPEEIDVEIFGSSSFVDPGPTEATPLLR